MRKQTLLAGAMIVGGIAATCVRAATPDTAPTAPMSPTTAPSPSGSPFGAGADDGSSPFGGPLGSAAGDATELLLFKDMPVVVAAGKRVQTQREAPASVSVIDAEDIRLFNYESLADALRDQRSFYLHTNGLNAFAGVRGLLRPGEYNSSILVTVDGRPTNDVIYGQSHLDRDFVVPMEAVQRIEVVRGPGSALYGSNADLAIINVVTKNGADLNGGQLKIEGGTQDTGRASLLYGTALPGGWDVLAEVTGYTSEGDRDIRYDGVNDAAHNFGHVRNFDYESVGSAFLKARNGDLTIQADFESRFRDNRSATYLSSFFDPGKMHEKRGNFSVRYDHEIAEGQSIHAMAYYGHYVYDQDIPYAAAGGAPAYDYVSRGKDDWVGEEIHYDWQVNHAFHLLFGADARQSLFARQTDHSTLKGVVLDIPSSFNTWGVFAEGEVKVNDWLSLTGGLRFDQVQRVGTSFSPRLAAVISPTKADAVKLLYGRAFRTPNLYEQLYASPGFNVPNPGLKPELVDTYEVVWERSYAGGWHTTLDGYLWRLSHAMEDYVFPNDSVQTRNGGTIWAHGVEAEVSKRWDTGARVRAFATYTRAERHASELAHSPQWIVGAAAAVPVINRKTFLSVEPQIVGQQKSDLGQYTPPTFITNVVLTSKDVVEGWDVQAGVYNLFANSARLPRDGAFNQFQPTLNYPGTRFLISLTHRF